MWHFLAYMNNERLQINKSVDYATISNPLGASRHLSENLAVIKSIDAQGLKSRLGLWLGLSPENITLSNGSDEIIKEVPKLFLRPKDICLFPTPTYFSLIRIL